MNLPIQCPSCGDTLHVKSLLCEHCGTEVSGNYLLPPIARLSPEKQHFLLQFILCSGSLKEMAALRKLSYPTVRNMLDDIIAELKAFQ